jgi:hypothetical protein
MNAMYLVVAAIPRIMKPRPSVAVLRESESSAAVERIIARSGGG